MMTSFPKSAALPVKSLLVMVPSGSEMAKVIVEYWDLIRSAGFSHLGGMAKCAFLSPGIAFTSPRSASGLKVRKLISSHTGTPCARRHVQPIEGLSLPEPWKGESRICSYCKLQLSQRGRYRQMSIQNFPCYVGGCSIIPL